MSSGFTSVKDVLDVIGIPVALALLALAWPPIQSWYRCRRFRLLACRELEEIGPFPEEPQDGTAWTNHLQKKFLHQKIIDQVSDNRDFILGLNPDFVYSLSQLWASFNAHDGGHWLWYLERLANNRYVRKRKRTILEIHQKWGKLIASYQSPHGAHGPAA